MQNDTAPFMQEWAQRSPWRVLRVRVRTKIDRLTGCEPVQQSFGGLAKPSGGRWGVSRGECESPGSWMSRAAKPPLDLAHAAPLNRGADG
jgi:hypothetical protein